MGRVAALLVASLALVAACRPSGPDWRILQLYSGETSVALLQHPEKVQAFRLAPPSAAPAAAVHVGPYSAAGAPVELPPETATELSTILADAATYDWRRVKRDPFRPQVGVWFVRGAYVLEIALDLESSQIAVYAGGQTLGAEDFDAARDRLVAIAKRTFPGDAAIQSYRARNEPPR